MKVTFEMESEQLDAIIIKELENRIEICYSDSSWCEDDDGYNEELKEALWIVLEYYTNENQLLEFRNFIEDKYGEENEI
jgi:hypothetical protein